MRSGIRRKAGFLAAAGLLDYALQLGLPVILIRHLTTQEFGARKLISKAYLLLAPCGGQGGASAERRQSALHRDLARTRGRCSTGTL